MERCGCSEIYYQTTQNLLYFHQTFEPTSNTVLDHVKAIIRSYSETVYGSKVQILPWITQFQKMSEFLFS